MQKMFFVFFFSIQIGIDCIFGEEKTPNYSDDPNNTNTYKIQHEKKKYTQINCDARGSNKNPKTNPSYWRT